MTKIVIEKGIEMPDSSRELKYPFNLMEVGDSFVCELSKQESALNTGRQSRAYKQGARFVSKKINQETCRIWRLK